MESVEALLLEELPLRVEVQEGDIVMPSVEETWLLSRKLGRISESTRGGWKKETTSL